MILNLYFSDFGNLAQSGESLISTQVQHLQFSDRFGQTKIKDLETCLEI